MNENRVINEIIGLKEDVRDIRSTMAIKTDFEKIVRAQNEMLVILKRLDQERVFTNEAIKKMQQEIEEQKQKIGRHDELLQKIKLELKIA